MISIIYILLFLLSNNVGAWEEKRFTNPVAHLFEEIRLERIESGFTKISLRLKEPFVLKQVYLDPIDLQVQASALQTGSENKGLDPGSSSIARLMWGFVPIRERVRFLKSHTHTAQIPQSLDSSGLSDAFRASLTRQGQKDSRAWFYESQIERERRRVLFPGFFMILTDPDGHFQWQIMGREPGNLELIRNSHKDGRGQRIPYHRKGNHLHFQLELPFEPSAFSLGLINEEGTLISHAGGKNPTSLRGAYLLVPRPEILPLVDFSD